MTEVPTTEWTPISMSIRREPRLSFGSLKRRKARCVAPPRWDSAPTFRHFPLELSVYATELPADVQAPEGMRWIPMADIAGEALPSLMRKVIAHAVR